LVTTWILPFGGPLVQHRSPGPAQIRYSARPAVALSRVTRPYPEDVAGAVHSEGQRDVEEDGMGAHLEFGYGVWVMLSSRRLVVSAVAATVALGSVLIVAFQLTGDSPDEAPGTRVVQPGAPGQPGRTLSKDELSTLLPPTHTAADTLFMQRMIPHHAQALEMTALVKGRGGSPDLPLLAERIEISQRDEIALMQRWLAERGEEISAPHASPAGHHDLMPGMLNDEQLGQLKQARGAEFDRIFLESMIHHHQGALTMVQELYATGGGLEPASDRFAREVTADQSIEIRRMQDLLAQLT
jgi:uncharacterized protein (DUF305 family)